MLRARGINSCAVSNSELNEVRSIFNQVLCATTGQLSLRGSTPNCGDKVAHSNRLAKSPPFFYFERALYQTEIAHASIPFISQGVHKERLVEIDVRTQDQVKIIKLRGKLNLGASLDRTNETLKDLLDAGESCFLLDLQEVPMIDSSGIGLLVRYLTATKQKGIGIHWRRNDVLLQDARKRIEKWIPVRKVPDRQRHAAARLEHPQHLPHSIHRRREEHHTETADGRIETSSREWQLLRRSDPEGRIRQPQASGSASGGFRHPGYKVDADSPAFHSDMLGDTRRRLSGSGGNIQHCMRSK